MVSLIKINSSLLFFDNLQSSLYDNHINQQQNNKTISSTVYGHPHPKISKQQNNSSKQPLSLLLVTVPCTYKSVTIHRSPLASSASVFPSWQRNKPHSKGFTIHLLFMYQHEKNAVFTHLPPLTLQSFRIPRKPSSPDICSVG